jgi:hypothetical protein
VRTNRTPYLVRPLKKPMGQIVSGNLKGEVQGYFT